MKSLPAAGSGGRRQVQGVPFRHFCRLAGFNGLTTAQDTFGDLAFDAEPVTDMPAEQRERAAQIFGPITHAPESARRVVAMVKGRDVGGTRLGAVRLVHLAATMPLERLDREEEAYCLIVAPKIPQARPGKRFALMAARAAGLRIEGEHKDGFCIVRHDGRRVVVLCIPAGRGGDTGRGLPIVFAMLDEAAFFRDEATGAINDRDVFNALIPRLLPGGQILIVSSPWTESGLLYTEFSKNFGAPETALAAFCPTLVMRDDAETRANVELEMKRDPENAAREYGAQFLGGGASEFFASYAIAAAADGSIPLFVGRKRGAVVGAGADFGFVSDSSALAIVQCVEGLFHLSELLELRPSKGAPLQPSAVFERFAGVALSYGGRDLTADGHYRESVREHLTANGLVLQAAPEGQAGKVQMYTRARTLLHEGRVRLPNHPRLLQQLRDVVARPTPGGGLQITSPRRSGVGGHGDLVSAFVAALWRCEQRASRPVDLTKLDFWKHASGYRM